MGPWWRKVIALTLLFHCIVWFVSTQIHGRRHSTLAITFFEHPWRGRDLEPEPATLGFFFPGQDTRTFIRRPDLRCFPAMDILRPQAP